MDATLPDPALFPEVEYPKGCAFVDGRFMPMSEAKISILDFGFTRSDVTFDVVHAWQRKLFRLDLHLARFFSSIEKLRMKLPFGPDQVTAVVKECVKRGGFDDAYVAILCSRGLPLKPSRDFRNAVNRFVAYAIPFSWVANEEQRARGLDIGISDKLRIPPASVDPTAKNYHRLDFQLAMMDGYEQGFDTVVLVDQAGNITEGPGYNVFAVKDGRAATPDAGVLEGITRHVTLELCQELQIKAVTRPVSVAELRAADEVFITSTAGGIMPVAKIDHQPVSDGRKGPIFQRLHDVYWAKHDDPAWTTPID